MAVLNGLETWEHMFGVMSDGNPMETAVKEVKRGNNSKFKYINLEL